MAWTVTRRQPVEDVTCAQVSRWLGDPNAPDVGQWFDDAYARLLEEDGLALPAVVDWPLQFKLDRFRIDIAQACWAAPTDEPAWPIAAELYAASPETYR